MGRKRYKSLTGTQYTFPVSVEGKRIWISFGGNENDYATSNTKVQAAIEATAEFKRRMIGLVGGEETPIVEKVVPIAPATEVVKPIIPANPVENPKPKEDSVNDPENPNGADEQEVPKHVASYPDVVDINGAVAVLRGDPYKVHHMSLQTPEAIIKQAAANNVVFPNWKTE